jgi:hypothetical protein
MQCEVVVVRSAVGRGMMIAGRICRRSMYRERKKSIATKKYSTEWFLLHRVKDLAITRTDGSVLVALDAVCQDLVMKSGTG